MNVYKNLILLTLTLFTSQLAMSQNIYKGTVVDNITHEPLECACVRAGGKLCCTNRLGEFRLSLPTDTATITITFIGYTTMVLPVKTSGHPLTIGMNSGQVDLNEVIIAPSLNCSSFHNLSTLDLNLRPINSSQDLMRLVPGLFIAQHMGGARPNKSF